MFLEKERKWVQIIIEPEQAVAYKATKLEGASVERDCRREMEHCEEYMTLSTDDEAQTLVQPKALHGSHRPKLLPMNGGDGPFSYAHNSSYQKEIVEAARNIIAGAILDKFDINSGPSFDASSNPIRVADFGCSVGPNTFVAIENIINALNLKYMQDSKHLNPTSHERFQSPEFQVFFNDLIDNDFNTLFRSLPSSPACCPYFPNGVPGSFRHRLFPKSSLHLAHSAHALHWLSQIPETVKDPTSIAFNKGHVYCSGTVREVTKAFSGQFKKDLRAFMRARAEEIVGGGLMVLHFGCLPKGVTNSETSGGMSFQILGTCLMDMVNKGLLSVEKVESFNIPLYFATIEEVEALIEEFTDHFILEGMEQVTEPRRGAASDVQTITLHVRAALEGFLMQHFCDDSDDDDKASFVEELFQRFSEKLADNHFIFDLQYRRSIDLFVILRRNV